MRASLGKDPTGTITLHARREGARIVVEVRDDGAGLSRDRIAQAARAMGLLGSGEGLPEAEIERLLVTPGFSTAAAVTDLSGRGVGMDIVSRNVSALKGTIAISSAPGQGTAILMRVPLTLAIIDGFTVDAAGETYVIPLESVRGCVDLPPEARANADGSGVINLRGELLPYMRVRDLFGLQGPRAAVEQVVIVEHEGLRAGLAVDALRGENQSVVKPLNKLFERIVGITGTTILGNGKVALILDVPAILDETKKRGARAAAALGAL